MRPVAVDRKGTTCKQVVLFLSSAGPGAALKKTDAVSAEREESPTRAPLSGGVFVLQGRCETLWELAGFATTGTHGGYNDSPE